jgi:glyoxylase-like metal-dependent hydrolase (beta-lactamase superfamily II)
MVDFDPAHVERGGPVHRYPGGPLLVTKLSVGPYDNNAYVLVDSETRQALLVDAANEEERLLELLRGVELVGVVTTHRHPDHIQALPGVLREHHVWNGAHPADAGAIASQVGVRPDRPLEHGDTVAVGRFEVGVLHTPGHTEGSISFKLPSEHVLTGDAVFPGGVGSTIGREAFDQAIASAERHVLSLGDQTRISPGHGDDTWAGKEAPHLDEWKARGW